jgi:IS5 family transposase
MKSKVHPNYKTRYKVRNWASYDQALVRRGDVTIWLSPRATRAWTAVPSLKPGGQRLYSDVAIEAALTLRLVFGLAWRQTEGLLNSVLTLMELELRSPDHTTLSRRSRGLDIAIPQRPAGESLHVILDATGLKVFGQGEWAAAKHGPGTTGPGWRKLHLAVDDKGNILAVNLTESEVADAAAAPDLIAAVGGDIVRITADGGYDRLEVYEAASRVGAIVVIPPRKDAVLSRDPILAERNQHIAHRKRVGKRQWRVDTGHPQQARVENTFHRYKRTFGSGLRARTEDGQLVEVLAGCMILNRMLEIGKPESIAVRA